MCLIYDVLLQNVDLRSFVEIYALLRGEKFSQELRPVEKKLLIWGMVHTATLRQILDFCQHFAKIKRKIWDQAIFLAIPGTFSFGLLLMVKQPKNSPKQAKFQNKLKTYPKLINAQNKCWFHHFGGILLWKGGLRFCFFGIQSPIFERMFTSTFSKSAQIRVPKIWILGAKKQKRRPLSSRQHPPIV